MPLTTSEIKPTDTVNLWEIFERIRGWIDTLNNQGTQARYWSGYPVTKTVADGKNVSVAMGVQIETVGGVAPTFDADTFKLAAGRYRIDLQVRFDQASGGYRTVSLMKNPTATTWNSTSNPPGTYLRSAQVASSSNDTTVVISWVGTVSASDALWVVVRQTSGSSTGIVGTAQDSNMTIERMGD
jgi:hypothetical protein